ncbi:MAG: hypothetical protein JKY81_01550 [Colwellia sp.]|nr:hypothetical protein [Colwellia sp.]
MTSFIITAIIAGLFWFLLHRIGEYVFQDIEPYNPSMDDPSDYDDSWPPNCTPREVARRYGMGDDFVVLALIKRLPGKALLSSDHAEHIVPSKYWVGIDGWNVLMRRECAMLVGLEDGVT